MTTGTWMEKDNFQMHGQASRFILLNERHLKDVHGPRGDLRGNKQPQHQTMCGQRFGSMCLMQRNAKQKWTIEKPKLDNARQSSSLNQMMKNSNTQ